MLTFLQSFQCFIRTASPETRINFFRMIYSLRKNFSLGSIFIRLAIGELYRTFQFMMENYNRFGAFEIENLVNFSLYQKLLHSLLHDFSETAQEAVGVTNNESKVSPEERRQFAISLDQWSQVLVVITEAFSLISPQTAGEIQKLLKKVNNLQRKIFVRN